MNQAKPLGAVVGANIAALRAKRGWSQHRTVFELGRNGLGWSRSALSAVEAGRRQDLELSEAILLAHTFDVPLWRLFDGEGRIDLAPGRTMDLSDTKAALKGKPTVVIVDIPEFGELEMRLYVDDPDDVDIRVASRLNVDTYTLRRAGLELWGHSLTAERDRRAGVVSATDDSQRSVLGHITRQLTREIAEHIGVAS